MTVQIGARSSLDKSVVARFADWVERCPENVAIRTPEGALSLRELDRLTNRVARSVPPTEDRRPAAVLCVDEIDFQAAQLGVLKAGRPFIPVHPGEPAARLALILDESGSDTVIVSDGPAPDGAGSDRQVISMKELAEDDAPLEAEIPWDDPALLMYTSGSTGVPKGIVHSHRSLLARSEGFARALSMTADDRVLLVTRMSSLETFAAFLSGASLCSFDVRARGIADLPDWIRDQGISVLRSPPSLFRTLAVQAGARRLPDLRLVVLAGEMFSPSDLELFRSVLGARTTLLHLYGSSEAGVVTTQVIDERFDSGIGVLPVGAPVPEATVTLMGGDGQDVAGGETGIIVVSTPALADGYLGRDDLTRERFLGAGSARRFITGDLGRWDEQGRLEYVGRDDAQVKVRGNRVEIGEVEEALRRVPGLAEVVVVPRPDGRGSTQLVGYYTYDGATPPQIADIRSEMSRFLPGYMIPTAWIPMTSFPITAHGKIDRRSLPEPERSTADSAAAGPAVAVRLAAIWSELLGVEAIAMSDSFFDLGGDSLAAAGLVAAVEQEFGRRIPMADLFEHDTLELMCMTVEAGATASSGGLLLPVKRTGDLPPLYCLHMPGWKEGVYWQLSRHVSSRRPMIGVFDDPTVATRPGRSLIDTARRHAELIRDASDGPYHLLGYSGAGVIAYEVGRQLTRLGAEVAFVGMIDSGLPDGRSFPFKRLVRALSFKRLVGAVRRRGLTAVTRLAMFRIRHRLGLLRDTEAVDAEAETARRDQLARRRSYHRHRIRAFDGPVAYFRADGRRGRSRAIRGWRRLVSDVVDVPGTHAGPDSVMGERHAEELACALESALAAAGDRAGHPVHPPRGVGSE